MLIIPEIVTIFERQALQWCQSLKRRIANCVSCLFKHFYEAEYAKRTGFRCAVASLNTDGGEEPVIVVLDFGAGEIRDDTDKCPSKSFESNFLCVRGA